MGFEGIRRGKLSKPIIGYFQVLDQPVPSPSAPSTHVCEVSAWQAPRKGPRTQGFPPPGGRPVRWRGRWVASSVPGAVVTVGGGEVTREMGKASLGPRRRP